jgi:hypothetical protein
VLGAREGWPRLRDWWAARQAAPVVAEPPAVQNAPVAITTTKEKYTEARPVETTPPVEASAPPPAPPTRRSQKRPHRGAQMVALPTPPVTRSAPPVEAAPAPEPAPAAAEPPVPVKPAEPKRVSVEIRARNLFCDPSLDDDAPSISPAVSQPREGKHRVYCTLPGGTRHLVAVMHIAEFLPGAPFQIHIKKGENGKPTLDPDRTTRPRQPDPGAAGKPGAASPPAE